MLSQEPSLVLQLTPFIGVLSRWQVARHSSVVNTLVNPVTCCLEFSLEKRADHEQNLYQSSRKTGVL